MTKQTFLITADAWVQVGSGATDVSFVGSAVMFAESADAPTDAFTGDVYTVRPTGGNRSMRFAFNSNVWAKAAEAAGATASTKPAVVDNTAQPVVDGVSVTPGVAYAAGQSIGGLFRLKGVMASSAAVTIASAVIRCKSVQTAGFKLYLFAHKPTNSVFADQAKATLHPDDAKLFCGLLPFSDPDSDLGVSLYQTRDQNIGVVGEDSLYAVLVPTAAATFSATDDLSIEVDLAI